MKMKGSARAVDPEAAMNFTLGGVRYKPQFMKNIFLDGSPLLFVYRKSDRSKVIAITNTLTGHSLE